MGARARACVAARLSGETAIIAVATARRLSSDARFPRVVPPLLVAVRATLSHPMNAFGSVMHANAVATAEVQIMQQEVLGTNAWFLTSGHYRDAHDSARAGIRGRSIFMSHGDAAPAMPAGWPYSSLPRREMRRLLTEEKDRDERRHFTLRTRTTYYSEEEDDSDYEVPGLPPSRWHARDRQRRRRRSEEHIVELLQRQAARPQRGARRVRAGARALAHVDTLGRDDVRVDRRDACAAPACATAVLPTTVAADRDAERAHLPAADASE
jgi:hypothetical protein